MTSVSPSRGSTPVFLAHCDGIRFAEQPCVFPQSRDVSSRALAANFSDKTAAGEIPRGLIEWLIHSCLREGDPSGHHSRQEETSIKSDNPCPGIGTWPTRFAADSKKKFVRDFVAAWCKVMDLDRFDLR